MTKYSLSYFVKNVTEFEKDATVTEMSNGWFYVTKTVDALSPKDIVVPAKYGRHAMIYNLCATYEQPKQTKRKAIWKESLLSRISSSRFRSLNR
jgi:hypothetical protein